MLGFWTKKKKMTKDEFAKKLKYGNMYCMKHDVILQSAFEDVFYTSQATTMCWDCYDDKFMNEHASQL